MRKTHTVILGSLISITLLSAVILSSTITSATTENTDIIDQVNVTVPVSCSMEATGMDSHITQLHNNEYNSNVGTTNAKAYCNDVNGFAIYTIGYTDDTDGKNVLTDSNLASTNDITTGVTTSGDYSKWAMKLTTPTNPTPTYPLSIQNNFDSFHTVPDDYTMVAKRTSATDAGSSAIGSTFTTTYQIYIGPTQSAGTYEGQVKYVLVHPSDAEVETQPSSQTATPGCINYFPNGNNVVGTMGCQSATDNAKVMLLASNFSRDGYGFAGWSDTYDYATNANAHFYGPQEDIKAPVGTTENGFSLYAVWVKSAGSMQTHAMNVCNSLTTASTNGTANLSSVSALTDRRDGETYAIAKLADGKCWMIENLRLESTNSDNSTGSLAQGYGTSTTYGNFNGLADAENTGFSNTYTANSLYYSGTQSGTATIDIGTTNYPAYRMPRYNNYNNQAASADRPQNPTSNSDTNSTTNASMYSYGNYYTWHAAVADLTHNNTNNNSTTSTSLCPAGWHLPTGGQAYASGNTSGVNVTGKPATFREFYNLAYMIMSRVKTAYEDTPYSGYSYYSSSTTNAAGKTATTAFRSFPNNFLYSGSFDASSTNTGRYGLYWSSTAYGNYYSYHLYLMSSRVTPGSGYGYKYIGYTVRCVFGS